MVSLPQAAPLRVLTNLPLPQPEGFVFRHFGDYADLAKGLLGQGGWQPQNERRTLKEILSRIPAPEKPNILLFRSPEYLPLPTDLAPFPGLKILLITDWNLGLRFLPALCGLFDVCFTDPVGADLLRKAGAKNVLSAALYGHDARSVRDMQLTRDLDLSFCGNLNAGVHRARNRILTRLLPLRNRHKLHLTQSFGPDYIRVLSRSRLVFNYSLRGEANMRLFEAMACGAVPLVEKGNVEVPQLFQEGVHYATYPPENPAETIDALLAQPQKIAAMSAAAKAAAAEQTQDKQLGRLLKEACARFEDGWRAPGSAPGGAAEKAGQRALQTMRMVGTGFTLRESVDEAQAASSQDPGLKVKVFPGLLLSLLDRDKSKSEQAPILLRMIGQWIEHPEMPAPIAALHNLSLALAGGRAASILAAAENLESLLSHLSGPVPEDWYQHLLAPADPAKPLNSDLNGLYRKRLEDGHDRAFLEWMQAYARSHQAMALKRLDRLEEAQAIVESLPAGRYVTIEPFAIAADLAAAQGRYQTVVTLCRRWHAENPLEMKHWDMLLRRLVESGDTEALRRTLQDLCLIAEAFLREGIPPRLAEMARQYKAVPSA
jgi:Glycosyl transferases group 1